MVKISNIPLFVILLAAQAGATGLRVKPWPRAAAQTVGAQSPRAPQSKADYRKALQDLFAALGDEVSFESYLKGLRRKDAHFEMENVLLTSQEAHEIMVVRGDRAFVGYLESLSREGDTYEVDGKQLTVGEVRDRYTRARQAEFDKQLESGPRLSDYYVVKGPVSLPAEAVRVQVKRRHQESFRAYAALLPRDGEYYVVEGDLLLTEAELADYLLTALEDSLYLMPGVPSINRYRGTDDINKTRQARRLTYAVDRESFGSAERSESVAAALARAGQEWGEACGECGVEFRLVEARASTPDEDVNFVVRAHDAGGNYLASAFFPHAAPERRYLNIDPSYFAAGPAAQVAVLRHQLGHVLGYRHAQPREAAGCYPGGLRWLPLSEQASPSAMQYYCAGSVDLPPSLTERDRSFHRKVYMPIYASRVKGDFTTETAKTAKVVVIRFQNRDIVEHAGRVLLSLYHDNLLRIAEAGGAEASDNLQAVYLRHLLLPSFSASLSQLADELNRPPAPGQTTRGATLYPEVKFNSAGQVFRLDTSVDWDQKRLKDIKQNLAGVAHIEPGRAANRVTVVLPAYELRLLVAPDQVEAVLGAVRRVRGKESVDEIVVFTDTGPANYFGRQSTGGGVPPQSDAPSATQQGDLEPSTPVGVKDYVRTFENKNKPQFGLEGDILKLLGKPPRFPQARCDKARCPDIVLVDKPVGHHPDIIKALKGYYPNTDNVIDPATNTAEAPPDEKFRDQAGRQLAEIAPADPAVDHGTFMAGLIASGTNSYGLIGVNPDANIYSVNWDKFVHDRSQFVRLINKRQENARRKQIYVFATDWPYDPAPRSPEMRWEDGLALRISSTVAPPLVITAAGDSRDRQKPGLQIGPTYDKGPAGLGDLPNVIVVTAVDKARALARWANTPQEGQYFMIHIAAPGEEILSTLNPDSADVLKYGYDEGTSPATALVAGVASLMLSYYEADYANPMELKSRLQTTSDPLFVAQAGGSEKVHPGIGILNPAIAMLPAEQYLLLKAGQPRHEAVPEFSWATDTLKPNRVDDERQSARDPINTEDIYRIMRVERTNSRGEKKNVWVFYVRDPAAPEERKDRILRKGPFTFKNEDLVLIQFKDKTTVKLSQITDLLLFNPNGRYEPPPPDPVPPIQSQQ